MLEKLGVSFEATRSLRLLQRDRSATPSFGVPSHAFGCLPRLRHAGRWICIGPGPAPVRSSRPATAPRCGRQGPRLRVKTPPFGVRLLSFFFFLGGVFCLVGLKRGTKRIEQSTYIETRPYSPKSPQELVLAPS